MHTGVSSSWVVWQVFFERYTRVLLEASPEFPIHFLKIYRFTMIHLLVPVLLLLSMATPGSSSDTKGNYVALGFGLEACQTFLQA